MRNQQIVKTATSSFPFLPILTLIFITLKLVGYITWSWWWVLSPIWIPFLIAFLIIIAAFVFYAIAGR